MEFVSAKMRLKQYLDKKGVGRMEFYARCGLKRGLLDSDKMDATISDVFLAKIVAAYPDLNLEWLVTGRGKMLREQGITYKSAPGGYSKASDVAASYSTTAGSEVSRPVPLYDLESLGGLKGLFAAKHPQPMDWVSVPGSAGCEGAVKLRGEAMYPLLKGGDIVLFKKVTDKSVGVFWGEMYLVDFELDGQQFLTVNYVQKSDVPNCVRLASYNPSFAPKDIPFDSIRALAMVKASIRY